MMHNRRYMGHKRTIRPNAKRLSALFMARNKMDWDAFARKVKSCQRGFMGEPDEMKPGRGEFHEFPDSCICEKQVSNIGNNNNGDHNFKQVTLDSSDKVKYKGEENQGEKIFNNSMGKEIINTVDDEFDEHFPD